MTTQTIDGFPAELHILIPAAKWENLKANAKEARAAAKKATERAIAAETAAAAPCARCPSLEDECSELRADLELARQARSEAEELVRLLEESSNKPEPFPDAATSHAWSLIAAARDMQRDGYVLPPILFSFVDEMIVQLGGRAALRTENAALIDAIDEARAETEATKVEMAELRRCAEETAVDLRRRLEIAGNERDSWKAVAERRGRELDEARAEAAASRLAEIAAENRESREVLPLILEELGRRRPGPESPIDKLRTLLHQDMSKACTTSLMDELLRRAVRDEMKGSDEGIGRAKRWRRAARHLGIIAGVRT